MKWCLAPLLLCLAGCATNANRDNGIYGALLETNTIPASQPAGSLTLVQALSLANAQNENLAVQGESLVRQINQKRRSFSAFFPTLSAAAQLRALRGGDNDGENFDLPISLDWVLFDGGQNINSYWRDRYLIEREKAQLFETQESLLYDVSSTYYAILSAESQVRVLESSLALQEERLRDARGRLAVGVARPLDVSQTLAQVAQTRVTLIEAKRQVVQARLLLSLLTDAPVNDAKLSDDYAPTDTLGGVDALMDVAHTYRSTLLASQVAVLAARRDVNVAIGQYYPTVSLGLDGFLYRETDPSSRRWDGILQASVPIFTAGRIAADVRIAWSFLREALLLEHYTHRQVLQEVSSVRENLLASFDRVRELQVSREAARDALLQSQASYDAGLATNLERVTAQDFLLQAELATVAEEFNQKLLWLDLLRATGTLRERMLNK